MHSCLTCHQFSKTQRRNVFHVQLNSLEFQLNHFRLPSNIQNLFYIMTDTCHPLNDLIVRLVSPNQNKSSIVWSYFGYLCKLPDQKLDDDRFYCRLCLDALKTEKSDRTLSSVRKRIGVYSSSSSTGNMRHHLLGVHKITEPQQAKATNEHVQSMFSRNRHSSVVSRAKERLAHQLTLMCCRDLLPFAIVEHDGWYLSSLGSSSLIESSCLSGFQDFLLANGVVSTKSEIPSRTMLSPICLNKISDHYIEKIKHQLKEIPSHFSMTSDMWSDKYRHSSFICFTIHFIGSNSCLYRLNLKTEPFDGAHTGEAIAQKISCVVNEYNLNLNNMIMVRHLRRDLIHRLFLIVHCPFSFLLGDRQRVKHAQSMPFIESSEFLVYWSWYPQLADEGLFPENRWCA